MNVPNLFIDPLMNPQITITNIAFETLKGQISNILVANNIYYEIISSFSKYNFYIFIFISRKNISKINKFRKIHSIFNVFH